MVPAKLVFAVPYSDIFRVIVCLSTPPNSLLSIISPRAIVPSALMTQANRRSNSVYYAPDQQSRVVR
jgi:hypothetical protein